MGHTHTSTPHPTRPCVSVPSLGSHCIALAATQADTHVAHDSQHLPATTLEKWKSRMVLDSPASVTTMAADLQDLSRARPPPAPSHSFLSPVRAAMQQLDYRVADLETPAAQGRVLTWQWWRVRGFLPGCTPRMHMSIVQCHNARNVL